MFNPLNMSRVTCHVSCVMCHVSHVTCHMSHVTCHMSHVMCHMSQFFLFFFYNIFFLDKMVKLICGGSVINGAYPVQFLHSWEQNIYFKNILLGPLTEKAVNLIRFSNKTKVLILCNALRLRLIWPSFITSTKTNTKVN